MKLAIAAAAAATVLSFSGSPVSADPDVCSLCEIVFSSTNNVEECKSRWCNSEALELSSNTPKSLRGGNPSSSSSGVDVGILHYQDANFVDISDSDAMEKRSSAFVDAPKSLRECLAECSGSTSSTLEYAYCVYDTCFSSLAANDRDADSIRVGRESTFVDTKESFYDCFDKCYYSYPYFFQYLSCVYDICYGYAENMALVDTSAKSDVQVSHHDYDLNSYCEYYCFFYSKSRADFDFCVTGCPDYQIGRDIQSLVATGEDSSFNPHCLFGCYIISRTQEEEDECIRNRCFLSQESSAQSSSTKTAFPILPASKKQLLKHFQAHNKDSK